MNVYLFHSHFFSREEIERATEEEIKNLSQCDTVKKYPLEYYVNRFNDNHLNDDGAINEYGGIMTDIEADANEYWMKII